MERDLPAPLDLAPRYRVKVSDRFWNGVYLRSPPCSPGLQTPWPGCSKAVISVYLTYSFITLVVLLAVML